MDDLDRAIIAELQTDARLSMRELARRVPLSAPAVGERVRRLEESGIIRRYTVDVAVPRASLVAFIEVTMRSAAHERFLRFYEGEDALRECSRVSGAGCYFLRAECAGTAELDALLERLLEHANYRVSIAVSTLSKGSRERVSVPDATDVKRISAPSLS